jgi:hypothetical protein
VSTHTTFHRITRRRFLSGAATTAAAAAIVPRHVLGGPAEPAPSDVITYGVIGNGGRKDAGLRGMNRKAKRELFKKVAVCDVDTKRLGGEADNKTRFTDFRRMLERKDIDVVCIGTPPHWHAIPCIAAAQAGKDIFCEKPMTKFIAEGRAVADAVRRYGVVFQLGTFKRFGANRAIRKMILGGIVKDLHGVVAIAGSKNRLGKTSLGYQPVPPELDYDLWLGPAPYKPYNRSRVHYSNRFYWDYEGGDLANFGAHSVDPLQYTLAKDGTGPVEVLPHASWPQHPDAVGPFESVALTYADGLKLVIRSKGSKSTSIQGKIPKRREDLDRAGRDKYDALPDPPKLLTFAEAIRMRGEAGGNAESSHRSATLLHLANIAIRVGRKIRWDPVKEQIVGDEAANRFVDIPMRAPWHL